MLKHPYELNCSRELGRKTKTYPFKPSFLLYFSNSDFFLFSPFSLFLLEFLKILNSPKLHFFLCFFFFEISGNHRFSGRVDSLGGVCKLVGLFLRIRPNLAQFLELRYMHQHMYRGG